MVRIGTEDAALFIFRLSSSKSLQHLNMRPVPKRRISIVFQPAQFQPFVIKSVVVGAPKRVCGLTAEVPRFYLKSIQRNYMSSLRNFFVSNGDMSQPSTRHLPLCAVVDTFACAGIDSEVLTSPVRLTAS